MYTVSGYPLNECPLNLLKEESEAAHAMKDDGVEDTGFWAKLGAVDAEIAVRKNQANL